MRDCPFCGSSEACYLEYYAAIMCSNCGAIGPDIGEEFEISEENAIIAWNMREN